MSKYTAGEWSRNTWPQGDAEIRIGAPGAARIATVHLRDVSINEQAANARLIIDAPKMYAELERAADALERIVLPDGSTPDTLGIRGLLARIDGQDDEP